MQQQRRLCVVDRAERLSARMYVKIVNYFTQGSISLRLHGLSLISDEALRPVKLLAALMPVSLTHCAKLSVNFQQHHARCLADQGSQLFHMVGTAPRCRLL